MLYEKYIKLGLPVFPVVKKWNEKKAKWEKKPACKNGFLDATFDMQKAKKMFDEVESESTLIGLVTGSLSKLVVVDIDVNKDGDIRSVDDLRDYIEDNFGPLPETFEVETISGGLHLYYKYDGKIKRKVNFLPGVSCDLLGDNGFVVAPDDKFYFIIDDDLENIRKNAVDLPRWISEKYDSDLIKSSCVDEKIYIPKENLLVDNEELERVKDALKNILSDDRDTWIKVGIALKGSMLDGGFQVWDEWSKKSSLYDRDDQVKRWSGFKPNQDITIATIFYLENELKEKPIVIDEPNFLKKSIKVKDKILYCSKDKFPKDLLKPPGLVGDLAEWLTLSAFKPQPILALGASIAYLGACLGQRVQGFAGVRTNIYIVGVGGSGCGKENARTRLKQLSLSIGHAELTSVGKIASDAGVISSIDTTPSQVFMLDEFGRILDSLNKSSNSHEKNISTVLMELYGSADSSYSGKIYSDSDKNKTITQPNLCLYGTTVPSNLYDNLTIEGLSDGFFSRLLFFESEEIDPLPNFEINKYMKIPEKIHNGVKNIIDLPKNGSANNSQNISDSIINPHFVPLSTDAEKLWIEYNSYIREERKKLRSKGRTDDVLNRDPQKALQIALIVGVTSDYRNFTSLSDLKHISISAESMQYAIDLTKHLSSNMLFVAENHVSSNDFHKESNKIMSLIRDCGEHGIKKSRLTQKTRSLKPRQRNEILENLTAAGDVFMVDRMKTEKSTNSARYYVAIEFKEYYEDENSEKSCSGVDLS